MPIEWSESIEGVDWNELQAMYQAAPLGNKDAAMLRTVFGNSLYKCFVYEDGKLVGAGRVLGDGADAAYLCDVAFLPSHQGTGLGTQLVARLIELAQGHRKIILYSVPGREGFYKRFGFKRMTTAMAIFENPEGMRKRGHLTDE
jgi:ribosomal protein S18 acetylase RimI-like enzyme